MIVLYCLGGLLLGLLCLLVAVLLLALPLAIWSELKNEQRTKPPMIDGIGKAAKKAGDHVGRFFDSVA